MVWQAFPVLPNIVMGFALEARQAAIVPRTDPRVAALVDAHPRLGAFLGRFRSAHGQQVEPSMVIMDDAAARPRYSGEALVSLRNCLSIAAILRQSSLAMLYPGQPRILYSDAFDFHPWQLDRHYDHMISLTPAVMALHQVDEFHGQPAPGVPVYQLSGHGVDRPLLDALIAHWDAAYERPRMRPLHRALFRSLNMAQAALAMPPATAANVFDYGRHCSLWISAFEILARIDANNASLRTVMTMLERKPFLHRRSRARRYSVRSGGQTRRVGLPLKLYQRLYQTRNDFLHGNPITKASLHLPGSGHFAPMLYRCALRSVLDLQFDMPQGGDLAQQLNAQFDRDAFEEPQYEAEEGLLRALVRPAEDEDD